MAMPTRYFAQPLSAGARGPRGARVLSSRTGQDVDTVFEVCRCATLEDADKLARSLEAMHRVQEISLTIVLP